MIERVGGREEIAIDVRVVCATHQNLSEMIANNQFREDLYYRLSEISINIPPLRERAGDSILLARAFLDRFASQTASRVKGFTQDGLSAIEMYSWPGNVRELENVIKKSMIMCESTMISAKNLELNITEDNSQPLNLREVREKAEKEAIISALSFTNNNISKTSILLGVSRPTLYDLMNKYDLK